MARETSERDVLQKLWDLRSWNGPENTRYVDVPLADGAKAQYGLTDASGDGFYATVRVSKRPGDMPNRAFLRHGGVTSYSPRSATVFRGITEALTAIVDHAKKVIDEFGLPVEESSWKKWLPKFSRDASMRTADMETPSVLDGLRKQKVLDLINRLLEPHTRGMHRDQYWAPIQAIRAAFEREGIPASPVDGSGRYEKEDGVDVRKVWLYEVPFLNQNGRPDKVYVRIVASGAGPVASPLDVYDVVAYAS